MADDSTRFAGRFAPTVTPSRGIGSCSTEADWRPWMDITLTKQAE
jgi:hypothetical protein